MEKDHDKDVVLRKLHDYLKEFKVGDENLEVSLTDKQRTDYISLGEKLRSSGWNYGVGYDTRWDIFESKVKVLIAES